MKVYKLVCDRCYDVIGDPNNHNIKNHRFRSYRRSLHRKRVVTDICKACQPHLDDNFNDMSISEAMTHLKRIGAKYRCV